MGKRWWRVAARVVLVATGIALYAIFPWVRLVVPSPAELDGLGLELTRERTQGPGISGLPGPGLYRAARVEQLCRARDCGGYTVDLVYTQYLSPWAARRACRAETKVTAFVATSGTWSGRTIGDESWVWWQRPREIPAGRIILAVSRYTISVAATGSLDPHQAAMFLEDLAARLVEN